MKTIFLFFLLASSQFLAAQSSEKFEGDNLILFLGKGAFSEELKELKANYKCEMANEKRYLSKSGIELILNNGALQEIHLFASSMVYGVYKGELPNKLKFGMYSTDVRKMLGKPLTSFSNGYTEFEFPNYLLSCWFDGGKLSQVGIATKDSP